MRRRESIRHSTNLNATLFPTFGNTGPRDGIAVVIRDISLGGMNLSVAARIAIGSMWRLQLEFPDNSCPSFAVLVRSCRAADGGGFSLGTQLIGDPAILLSAGAEKDRLITEAKQLAKRGTRPPWETPLHLVSHEPIHVLSLCAMSVAAESDLSVDNSILDCTLDIRGRLDAHQASVVGGSVYALQGAAIGELGSSDGCTTSLVLGETLRTGLMLTAADAALVHRQSQIFRRQSDMAELKNNAKLSHADRERITELNSEIRDLEAAQGRMESNSQIIRENEAARREARVEVVKVIHPGVVIRAGQSKLTFTRPLAGPVVLLEKLGEGFVIESDATPSTIKLSDFATSIRRAA